MPVSHREMEARIKRINQMPLTEAKRDAERLIADPTVFTLVRSDSESESEADVDLSMLAPVLRDFFRRYERIEERRGDLNLSRKDLRPSELDKRYLTLGTDIEHAEIVAQPGQELIYQIDGTESEDRALESWPSIYHYILSMTFP